MKRWLKLLIIAWLGLCFSLVSSVTLKAQTLPSQLVQQAEKYYQVGEYHQSIGLLNQASKAYQSQDEYLQQAQVLSLTSLAQQQLGQWQKAQQSLTDGFALMKSLAPSTEKNQVLAQIWNGKGHFQFLKGNYDQALDDWQTAEALYRQIGDRLGIAGTLLDGAQALGKMGFYRRSCNYVLEAFDSPDYDCENLTSVQLTSIIKQATNDSFQWQTDGLSSLSNGLLLMGKLSQAQTLIEANQTINANSSPIAKAKILLVLGNVHKAIALRDRARDDSSSFSNHSQTAINYYQKIANYSSQHKIIHGYKLPAQLNHLSLLIASEKWSKAQELANQIDLTVNNQPDLYTEVKFARSLEQLKQQNIALKYSWQDIADIYLHVSQQAQIIEQQRIQSYALGYLGLLQKKQNIKVDATPQQLIERALILAQADRAPEIAYLWQWRLGQIYRQQKNREKAIATYQSALDTLDSLRNDLTSLNREVQFDFTALIEPVYREYADLLLDVEFPSDGEFQKALNVIEALQVAELDNYFQDACTTFKPKSIAQIDKNAAVIHTIVLPDRLEVIMTMSDANSTAFEQVFRRHSQPVSEADLVATIQQLRQYIAEPDRVLDVKQLSSQIYDWLIKPFEADLNTKQPQNLVFVLDNILQTIPMSALYDGKQYLLEKYALAVTPGLRLLNPEVSPSKPMVLAGGVSKPLQIAQQKFSALDNVEQELNIFSQQKSKVLLNTQFTTTNLLEQLNYSSTSRIHLATHGQFSSNPNKTFLLLWQQLLTIQDFSNLLLSRTKAITNPIDLLVLSACDTARGDRRAALGLAGIAVRSGAISTVASLWQVNDESTAELMKNFYQQLAKNNNKAEALRQAQLQLWQTQDKDWEVPAFWSAYILIGNWLR